MHIIPSQIVVGPCGWNGRCISWVVLHSKWHVRGPKNAPPSILIHLSTEYFPAEARANCCRFVHFFQGLIVVSPYGVSGLCIPWVVLHSTLHVRVPKNAPPSVPIPLGAEYFPAKARANRCRFVHFSQGPIVVGPYGWNGLCIPWVVLHSK